MSPTPDALKGDFVRNRIANRATQDQLYRQISAAAASGMEKHMVREWWQQWAFKQLRPEQYAQVNLDLYNRWMGAYKTQPLESHANRVSHQVTAALTGRTHRDWTPPLPQPPARPQRAAHAQPPAHPHVRRR